MCVHIFNPYSRVLCRVGAIYIQAARCHRISEQVAMQDPIEGCQHQKSSTHDHRDVDRSFWSMSHQHYEQLQRTAQGELSEQQAADTWH